MSAPTVPIRFHGSTRHVHPLDGTRRVAYSWSCGKDDDPTHDHVIRCLWVWHDCAAATDPTSRVVRTDRRGWHPTGVAAHTLEAATPLHIEASVLFDCCGVHGFIRNGEWTRA